MHELFLRMSGENAVQRLGSLFRLTLREGRKSFFPEEPAPSCADQGANPPSKFDVSVYFVQYRSCMTGGVDSVNLVLFPYSISPPSPFLPRLRDI